MMDAGDEDVVLLDDVLGRIGSYGKHQLITLALMSLIYTTNSMYNVNFVFAVEDIGYRCKVSECESSPPPWLNFSSPDIPSVDDDDGMVKQCSRYALVQNLNGKVPGDNRVCGVRSFNTSSVKKCTEWVYDNPHSFVAEFGLACEEWKQSLVGTAHSFGNMLGVLVQGQISDRFGRKTAAVFSGTMGGILGLAKSFTSSFWVYVGLETLESAIGDALSPMFMLSIEFVPKKQAIFYQMVLLNCYTIGLILMAIIAWAVPYWRTFLRVIYAPTILVLTYTIFLDESPRWLFSKGKRDRAIESIQRIAKRNGVEIDKSTLYKLDYIGEETNSTSDLQLLKKTLISRVMMQRFLVCMFWWFTITLINYGMMISSVFINGNKYINFALLMMMDIPSNILYWLVLVNSRRKMPLLCSFIVGGMFCVLQPFVPKTYVWLSLLLLMLFETLATFSYNIVYTYTSELFPTYTRNSMHALCSAVGRLGALIAPQMPLLISYWSGIPVLLFGLTSLLSGFLTFSMPETSKSELPNTVEEAEKLGKRTKKFREDKMENSTLMMDTVEEEQNGRKVIKNLV